MVCAGKTSNKSKNYLLLLCLFILEKGNQVEIANRIYENEQLRETFRDTIWQRKYGVLFIAVALIYILIGVSEYLRQAPGLSHSPLFLYLADGWLHGHLYINSPDTGDATFYNGHWYVAFPPLPAVLMLPLVAILHLSQQRLIALLFSLILGVINVGLMLQVLTRFAQIRRASFSFIAWMLIFFALGTETLYVTMQVSVWFQAHIVATTFLLLYIDETLGKQRPWLAGLFLGLAALSRSTTLFTFPFFIVLTFARERQSPRMMLKHLVIFGATLGLFVCAMLLYNWMRFGSLFDFGYTTMNVGSFVRANLHTYGQFSIHFLRTNLYYMGVQPPFALAKFPYVTFTTLGTGIFWTMPGLLFALLAFRLREQRWLALALLAGCILPIGLLLLYFNTGWIQFGNRFSMDYLPLVLLLAALGMRSKPGWPEKLLIALSVVINMWGYYAFAYFPSVLRQ